MNKVVARFVDGRVVKGRTLDFSPDKELFHMDVVAPPLTQTPTAIRTLELKALFFVKNLMGNPEHVECREFDSVPTADKRRIRAEFQDGEVVVGTTTGYRSGRPGFFLVPADAESNNERCFVVATATRNVRFI